MAFTSVFIFRCLLFFCCCSRNTIQFSSLVTYKLTVSPILMHGLGAAEVGCGCMVCACIVYAMNNCYAIIA